MEKNQVSTRTTRILSDPSYSPETKTYRTQVIEDQILALYAMNDRRLEEDIFSLKVKVMAQDLAHIPTEHLEEAFILARRENRSTRLITSGQILKAWDALKLEKQRKIDQAPKLEGPKSSPEEIQALCKAVYEKLGVNRKKSAKWSQAKHKYCATCKVKTDWGFYDWSEDQKVVCKICLHNEIMKK